MLIFKVILLKTDILQLVHKNQFRKNGYLHDFHEILTSCTLNEFTKLTDYFVLSVNIS